MEWVKNHEEKINFFIYNLIFLLKKSVHRGYQWNMLSILSQIIQSQW